MAASLGRNILTNNRQFVSSITLISSYTENSTNIDCQTICWNILLFSVTDHFIRSLIKTPETVKMDHSSFTLHKVTFI